MKFSFSKKFKNQKLTTGYCAGFTLIEMVTVIAIFVIVTGVILANLPSFRSKSSLDLVAQEVALQIRGAQMYSMSTLTGDDNTGIVVYGYGLKFLGEAPQKDIYLNTLSEGTLYKFTGNAVGNFPPNSFKEKYTLPRNFVYDLRSSYWKNPSTLSGQPVYLKFRRVTGSMTVANTDVPGNPWLFCLRIYASSDPSIHRFVIVRPGGQILVDTTCS